MITEIREKNELTSDELDAVTGGLSDSVRGGIFTALSALPVVGGFFAMERAASNAYYGTNV
jgi:hypothetical protein